MNSFEYLRLSRFDVVFLTKNCNNETIQCHFHTNALNECDASFIFGQHNQNNDYAILRVEQLN